MYVRIGDDHGITMYYFRACLGGGLAHGGEKFFVVIFNVEKIMPKFKHF